MRKFFTLLTLSAFLLIPVSIQATVLFDCNFNDSTLGRLSKGAWGSGTLASDNGWYTNGNPSTFRQVVAQQLTYSGYCSTASGRAVQSLSGQQKDYILFPAEKQHATISSGEKYYMSFLYKVTELNTGTNAMNGTNTYIAGLLMSTSGTGIAYTNAQVMATPINASTYKLGIRKITETVQYAEAVLNINSTYLIVAEYIVNSGSADDVVNLYINPSKNSKTIAATNTQVSAPTDKTGIVGVGILGIGNAPTSAIVDELKVTTSWDDLWESSGGDPDPDPDPESVPTPSPTASSITINSATISWDAVTGADSYVLQWKVNGGSWSSDIAIDKDVRSYSMSELSSNTKYYVQVKTIKGEDASDFAEINFTTKIVAPSPAASSITPCSAEISWENVTGANSYVLQWKVDGGSYSDEIAVSTSRHSYSMNNLNSATTFYVRVKTIIGERASDWTEISFATEAYTDPITYKGVTFGLWDSESALPTSGEYYLANNVERTTDVTLSGDLKLCLNGRTFTTLARIIIPDGVTLTLYDNLGGGSISGYYEASPLMPSGLIHIDDGGTLILHEGAVQNLNVDPNDGYLAYAIYNKGNLHVAGNPVITAATADINLFVSRYITLDGKLTNSAPYGVNASGQTITSGWSVMEDADPNVYFVSKKNTHKGIVLNAGEVKLVMLSDLDISLNESSAENESKLTAQLNENASLAITRSPLTNTQYNTICLPYSMDDDEMQLRFGEDYDLEEFVSSSIDGDVLNLTFNPVTTLVAGKPYLLKPSIDAPVLAYASVNIAAASPVDNTSDANISFHGTFNPTELEGGNRNLLFLGADNELLWPATTANIKGFRAYFEVKGGAQGAKRARIVKKEEGATGMDQITNDKLPMTNKILRNGQLLILRDNKTYNVLGMEYK